MLEIILPTLTAGLTFLVTIWLDRRKRSATEKQDAKCIEKITYFKVLSIKEQSPTSEALYSRNVPRLNRDISVFDECLVFSFLKFDKPIENYRTKSRSSGVIDSLILSPWVQELDFSDKGEAAIEGHLSQVIHEKVDHVISIDNYINGLQPGNENFAMKMPYGVKIAKLIVDFSSIPESKDFLTSFPEGFLCQPTQKEKKITVVEYRHRIFCMSGDELLTDDVIRMDVKVNWKKV